MTRLEKPEKCIDGILLVHVFIVQSPRG
jgi:hypothetical protein